MTKKNQHFICYIFINTFIYTFIGHVFLKNIGESMVHCIVLGHLWWLKGAISSLAEFDMEPIGNGDRKNLENLRGLLFRGLPIFPIFRVPWYHGHCDGSQSQSPRVLHHWIGGKNLHQDVIENGHLKAKLRERAALRKKKHTGDDPGKHRRLGNNLALEPTN